MIRLDKLFVLKENTYGIVRKCQDLKQIKNGCNQEVLTLLDRALLTHLFLNRKLQLSLL